jgi:hypothetical protein
MSHHEAKKLTHDSVQAWLDAYVHAWETYDAKDVEPLFTEDAEYRYHPYDEPESGRELIVFGWLNPGGKASGRDKPGTWSAELHPFAVDGNRAVVIGTCTYWTDASQATVDRRYFNNWLLEFAPDGRCRSFTEYYMKQPKA